MISISVSFLMDCFCAVRGYFIFLQKIHDDRFIVAGIETLWELWSKARKCNSSNSKVAWTVTSCFQRMLLRTGKFYSVYSQL
uniref:Uncharacterized protein n=1 Tax=Anguilla anguilla TaxID=7936 RepID=A0A0E9V5J7_ANGAN